MVKKEMLPQISQAYRTFGLYLTQVDSCVSPNLITLHYNLHNIDRLSEARKKLQLVCAMLHYDMEFKKSDIANFAIVIPVKENRTVVFSDAKYSNVFNKPFTIFAGVDDKNKPVGVHLTKSPHIMITGCSGSGKSIMLNSAICSLLKTSDKSTLKFYMLDTKKVELSKYRKLKDSCKVATEYKDCLEILKSVCVEMDKRYLYMEDNGLKQITTEKPRIVVCIEELADLMLLSKKEVEPFISRIAQLGRACNVNLILATQNPTCDVVTRHIKANIGCRFALKTSSIRESMNVIDYGGCEKLNGSGDCLLRLPVFSSPIRIQCPFITDEEIDECINKFNGGN